MRLRLPLVAVALLAGCLTAISGCDSSNPGSALADLDGAYALDELLFDPQAASLEDADVAARLDSAATELRIYGGDGDATLISRFEGQGSRRTDLVATASRGRLTLSARTTEDQNELADLLLPPTFSLSYTPEAPNTLTGNVSLASVNLQAFDPDRYQGLTSVSGVLRVRFSRL